MALQAMTSIVRGQHEAKSSTRPSGVVNLPTSLHCHPRRFALASAADTGPRTDRQVDVAPAAVLLAVAHARRTKRRGTHVSHRAMASAVMGAVMRRYAGSAARDVAPASARSMVVLRIAVCAYSATCAAARARATRCHGAPVTAAPKVIAGTMP